MKNVPTNLSNLKNKLDELDVDELIPSPYYLRKHVIHQKNDIGKKDKNYRR